MNEDIIVRSFADLYDDFTELEYIANSYLDYLKNATKKIIKNKSVLPKKSTRAVLSLQYEWTKKIDNFLEKIRELKKQANKKSCNLSDLIKLEKAKDENYYFLRSLSGIICSLITATDWQSPSFTHSLYSEAGNQTGKTVATINDYKRDWHLDEEQFEKIYLKEYIDTPLKFRLRVLMTSSGMSAFTTIFNCLLMQQKIKGKIIVGKSSYFQYKQILKESLREKVIEVDEENSFEIISNVQKFKPNAIFFDSLANAKKIPVLNLTILIDYLKKNYKEEIYLIIDNTSLSIFSQPFKLLGFSRKIHLLVFESLMKYHHFGLDRSTGGVIISSLPDSGKIFECRKHLGTNITDSSSYIFPLPERIILENRLLRYNRNAHLLSTSLQKYLDNNPNLSVKKIIYPGLSNHESYTWTKKTLFHGSFFNLEFHDKKVKLNNYDKFIKLVTENAKKNKLQIVGGTSFGLNNTRIYLTSRWSKYGEPFLRIAVGTENLRQVELLKFVFIKTLKKF